MAVRNDRPLFLEARQTLTVATPDHFRLGVVSDTHGRPHPALTGLLAAEAPDAILHAGDIGEGPVLEPLAALAPVLAVRGNIDGRERALPDGLVVTLEHAGAPLLVIYLTHIGVGRLGRVAADLRPRAIAAGASLVVCGHSHVPLIARDGALTLFNPGSCGPARFQLPVVCGVIEGTASAVLLRHLDCTTGGRWTPPPLKLR